MFRSAAVVLLFSCAMSPMLHHFLTCSGFSTQNQSQLPHPDAKPVLSSLSSDEKLLSREERHVPLTQPEGEQQTAGSATTLAFIEVIVKRTVNQYMKVIRTQADWFERLLQLVREELDIRSKYNCSTDACIYKIQLFTHYLHSHLVGAVPRPKFPPIRKRVPRSVVNVPIPADEPVQETVNLNGIIQSQLQNSELKVISDEPLASVTASMPVTSIPELPVPAAAIEDDALRLPEIIPTSNSQNHSPARDSLTAMVENDSSQPQASHFGTPDKINMVRVSQEVLSEALSKQQRAPSLAGSTETPTVRDDNPALDEQTTTTTTFSIDSDTAALDSDPSEPEHVESDRFGEIIEPRTDEPDVAEVTESISFQNPFSTNPPANEPDLELSPIDDMESAKHPGPEWNVNRAVERGPQRLHLDLSVRAIPFGQNEFVGKPYENCTGRFQNYCYNALKCVYISVLETAACYCRTGYTGVRCDMFNLPQTLDILRSFKEEIVDVPSLHQTNAVTLYSVVEATARYTVNAVLEENLLSAWEEDSIY